MMGADSPVSTPEKRIAIAAALDAWRASAPSAQMAERAHEVAELMRRNDRWDPYLFPSLVAIARLLGRASEARRINLGELLTAISGLPRDAEGKPWEFDSRVDPDAFNALGYAAASAGIADTQRKNREGWWAHSRHSRAFILKALERIQRPRLAVLLGAGKAFDLPVTDIASRSERVILVDIDAQALAETCKNVVRDAALRARLELRCMDLSGVSARLARGIEGAISSAPDGPSAEASLEALCRSYRLAGFPRLLKRGERADLVVSAMLLSQLALQPKLLAKQMFERRFGPVPRASEERWSWAWEELDLRLQQDHINALALHAEFAVLTSDVLHHSIYVSPDGAERPRGEVWSVIGTDTLQERIPSFVQIVQSTAWSWPRIRPKPPSFDGVHTEVNGLLLCAHPERSG